MPFEGLRDFLSFLDENDEVAKISKQLSNNAFEVSAILDRVQKLKGKAIIFENLENWNIPLCANVLGTFKRIAFALETTEDLVFTEWTKRKNSVWLKPKVLSSGPCQDVIINCEDVDLYRYPIMKWNPLDAAPYVTLGVLISKDPETGLENAGIYRLMVQGKRQLGVNLLEGKHALLHLEKAESRGKPLEAAVAIGLDPTLVLAAASEIEFGQDEFAFAGSLRGKPIELVKCQTVDINVPAFSEIIFEGIIPPKFTFTEGPFGENDGYYGKSFLRPVFKLNAITQRENPFYQATYTGKAPKEEHFISAMDSVSNNWSSAPDHFSLSRNVNRIFHSAYRRLKSEQIKLPRQTVAKVAENWASYGID